MTATCAVVQLYSCTAVQLVPFSTAAAWIGCGAPQWLSVVQLHRASDAEEHFRAPPTLVSLSPSSLLMPSQGGMDEVASQHFNSH